MGSLDPKNDSGVIAGKPYLWSEGRLIYLS